MVQQVVSRPCCVGHRLPPQAKWAPGHVGRRPAAQRTKLGGAGEVAAPRGCFAKCRRARRGVARTAVGKIAEAGPSMWLGAVGVVIGRGPPKAKWAPRKMLVGDRPRAREKPGPQGGLRAAGPAR